MANKIEDEEIETEESEEEQEAGKGNKKSDGGQTVELDWDMNPSERLKTEIESLPEHDQMRLVGMKLLSEFEKDPRLAEAYKTRKVSLSAVSQFIMSEARKLAVKNMAFVEDKTVYGWAIHFVQDGKLKDKPEKTLKVQVLPKQTEEELAEKARKDFYDAEMKRLEEEKRKQAELAEKKAKKEAERLAKKKQLEEERRKQSGQMSLFEFYETAEGGEA